MKLPRGTYDKTVALAKGLSLKFPISNKPTVQNSNFHDGEMVVQWAEDGDVIRITLTGLSDSQDMASYSVQSVNNLFKGLIV